MQTTTENDFPLCSVPSEFPTLRLLYQGGTGLVGRTFIPRPGVTLLGRGVSVEDGLPLSSDRMASNRHARLELSELRSGADGPSFALRIIDEGSRNGTFLNGQPITLANLHDGDVIRIGSSLILLRFEPARVFDASEEGMLGCSPVIRAVRHHLHRIAKSLNPVLLLGEPGVGKELAAQMLHRMSRRRGELIAVNCAAIPEHLAESLLFGHERGSFTGAETRQEGFFQAAEGGTLFLDEVGELSPNVQGKLLRVLQERMFTPVGRTRPLACDVRIIAATNRHLGQAVRSDRFRDDLYSRLRGEIITIPPLHKRREDILLLFAHALSTCGAGQLQLSARAAEALVLYHWPHNVRELWQMARSTGAQLLDGSELDLPLIASRFQPLPDTAESPREEIGSARSQRLADAPSEARSPRLSAEVLERLGREHGWNISQLARLAGRSRRQVRRWLEEYGLRPDGSGQDEDAHGSRT